MEVLRNCPKCKSNFKKINFQGIEVDRCQDCQGIWFDSLEHEKLKEIENSESIDIGDPEKGKKLNKIDKINCPICNSLMVRMVDNNQPHIWFEACTICNGVFFDAGEFKDFKEYTVADFFKGLKAKERR